MPCRRSLSIMEPTIRVRISFIGSRSSRVRARLARPRLVQLEQRGAVAFLAAAADKIAPAQIPPTTAPSPPRPGAGRRGNPQAIHWPSTEYPQAFPPGRSPSLERARRRPVVGRAMLSGERSVVRRPRLGPISTGAWPCHPPIVSLALRHPPRRRTSRLPKGLQSHILTLSRSSPYPINRIARKPNK
jgi:hypothetical protein